MSKTEKLLIDEVRIKSFEQVCFGSSLVDLIIEGKSFREFQREHIELKTKIRNAVEIAKRFRDESIANIPEDYTSRKMEYKYLKGDSHDAGAHSCAEEILSVLEVE